MLSQPYLEPLYMSSRFVIIWMTMLLPLALQSQPVPANHGMVSHAAASFYPPLPYLHVRKYTQKEGLAYNQINAIVQDAQQFIWLGGLAIQRFDGYRFKTYNLPKKYGEVGSMCVDKHQQLWVGTEGGIFKYQPEADSFLLFQNLLTLNNKPIPFTANCLLADESGNIWLAAGKAIAVLRPADSLFRVQPQLTAHHPNPQVHYLLLDAQQQLWYGVGPGKNSLTRYHTLTGQITHAEQNPKAEPIFNQPLGFVQSIALDSNRNIWLTNSWSDRQLFKFNFLNHKLETYTLKPPPSIGPGPAVPQRLRVDAKGILWVQMAEHFGLARYHAPANHFEYLYADVTRPNSLHDIPSVTNPSLAFYQDVQGNFWYAGQGLNLFSPYRQKVFSYTQNIAIQAGPFNNTALNTAQLLANGQIALGFYGSGLWLTNPSFQQWQAVPGYTSNRLIWDVFSPDGVRLFVSNQEKELFEYNANTQQLKPVPGWQTFANVTCSWVQAPHKVWLGHWREGLSLFNPDTYERITYNGFNKGRLGQPPVVWGVVPADSGKLWLAVNDEGLQLFNPATNTTEAQFFAAPNDPVSQSLNNILSATAFGSDSLLLSTPDGLLVFNTRLRKYVNILTQDNGLPGNFCRTAVVNHPKRLVIISTVYNGLCRWHLNSGTFEYFSPDEGHTALLGDQGTLRLPDGSLLMGSANGFTLLKEPFDASLMQPAPSVRITEIQVGQQGTLLPWSSKMPYQFKPSQNALRIYYSAMDAWRSSSLQYQVQLLPADDRWVNMGNQTILDYRNLASGTYTLRLRCRLPQGGYGAVTTLPFTIAHPFYLRSWFIVLLAMLLLLAGYGLYRYRIARVRRQERAAAQVRQLMSQLEMKSLRSQMNPHFIFNTLNSINSYIIDNNPHAASDYLTKFARLIRLILDNSKEETIPLSKELDTLQLYLQLERIRFQQKFDFDIKPDAAIDLQYWKIPPLILQPFVENSIWHGLLHKESDGWIEIAITQHASKLSITITDNGIGRAKAAQLQSKNAQHIKSMGMQITLQRLQLLNSANSITVLDNVDTDGKSAGTSICIEIFNT